MWPPTQGGSGTDGESRKREVVKCGKCGARGEGVIIIFDAGTKMANVPYNCGISHSLLLIVRPLRWIIGQRFYVWDKRLREWMNLFWGSNANPVTMNPQVTWKWQSYSQFETVLPLKSLLCQFYVAKKPFRIKMAFERTTGRSDNMWM